MPNLRAKEVPRARALYNELGFTAGNQNGRTQSALRELMKSFGLEYVSPDGVQGKDMRFWDSEYGNPDLDEMAREFLKIHGKDLWPSGDEERLIELLPMLFFRQNEHTYHNRNKTRYNDVRVTQKDASSDSPYPSHSPKSESRDASAEFTSGSGQTQDQPRGHRESTRSQNDQQRRSARPRKERVVYELSSEDSGKEEQDSSGDSDTEEEEHKPTLICKLRHPQFRDPLEVGKAFANFFNLEKIAPQAHMTGMKDQSDDPRNGARQRQHNLAKQSVGDSTNFIVPRKALAGRRNISGSLGVQLEHDRTCFTPVNESALATGLSASRNNNLATNVNCDPLPGVGTPNLDRRECEDDRRLKLPKDQPSHKRNASQMSNIDSEESKRPKSLLRNTHTHQGLKQPSSTTSIMGENHPTPSSHSTSEREQDIKIRACKICSSRHTKCDKKRPCSICKDNGYDCVYRTDSGIASASTTHSYHSLAQHPSRSSSAPRSADLALSTHNGGKRLKDKHSLLPSSDESTFTTNISDKAAKSRDEDDTKHPSALNVHKSNSANLGIPIVDHSSISTPSSTPLRSSLPRLDRKPQPVSASKTQADIRYFIVATSGSQRIHQRWSGGKLQNYTLDTFFKAISEYTPGSEILSIKFNLSSSQTGFVGKEYIVGENDTEIYEEMKEEFTDTITEGRMDGITKFRILFEPFCNERGALEARVEATDYPDIEIVI